MSQITQLGSDRERTEARSLDPRPVVFRLHDYCRALEGHHPSKVADCSLMSARLCVAPFPLLEEEFIAEAGLAVQLGWESERIFIPPSTMHDKRGNPSTSHLLIRAWG